MLLRFPSFIYIYFDFRIDCAWNAWCCTGSVPCKDYKYAYSVYLHSGTLNLIIPTLIIYHSCNSNTVIQCDTPLHSTLSIIKHYPPALCLNLDIKCNNSAICQMLLELGGAGTFILSFE